MMERLMAGEYRNGKTAMSTEESLTRRSDRVGEFSKRQVGKCMKDSGMKTLPQAGEG